MAYWKKFMKNKIITLNHTEIKTIDPDFIEIPDDLVMRMCIEVYISLMLNQKLRLFPEIEVPKIYNKLIKYLDIHLDFFESKHFRHRKRIHTSGLYSVNKIMNGPFWY